VSSTASNVSVTPAVASSPWPQTPAATQDNAQDNSGGPFAALVDAAAAAPDTTHTQPVSQPAAPRTSTATDQPAAKFSARCNNGVTGATQTTTPDAQAPAGATKNANAAAAPVASLNATVNPSAIQNATANQGGIAVPTDTTGGTALNVFVGAAATIVTDAAANAATADATTKPSSDNQDDSGSETDAGAAVATSATDVQVLPAGLAVAIASRAQAGSSQLDIRLDPPELGRIDVRRDGQVTSHVTVDRCNCCRASSRSSNARWSRPD
jgi:flagellar hook-length control protein FliK